MCIKRPANNLAVFRVQRMMHLKRISFAVSLPVIVRAAFRAKLNSAHEAAKEKKILLLKEKAREVKEQDREKLAAWRRGIALFLGHKNPDFKGKVLRSPEDTARDAIGVSFTYADQKDAKMHW